MPGGILSAIIFFPAQPAAIHDERAIANGVQCPFFLAGNINVGCHAFQYDDVVFLDDVDDLEFDVGQAFADQGCLHLFAFYRRQTEAGKLVGVSARTGANANHRIQHVHSGNGDDTLPGFAQRGVGMIPAACSDGEPCREIQHYGP